MYIRVSIIDIMSVSEARNVVINGTEEDFNKLLYTLGFDTNKPIKKEDCYHRPISNKNKDPVYSTMFVGEERIDDDWVKSPYCSFENKCELSNDSSLIKELRNMSREMNFSKAVEDSLITNKKRKRKKG